MNTEQVYQQIITRLEASLGQRVPLLPKAFIRVLARTLSAVWVTLFKYANWMFLQQFVTHASDEPTEVLGRTMQPLTTWGRTIGAGDRRAATPAELTVTVTAEQQGGTLPAGTQLRNPVTQALYTTRASIALDAPTQSVDVRAVTRGVTGNAETGARLEFVNPLTGVAPTAPVTAVTATGADQESPEDYRQRVLNAFQRRPQGGAYADYATWGGSVPGVRRVYPYTGLPGEVDVYVESTTTPHRVPTPAQLDAVDDAIQLNENGQATRRPANAWVNVYPVRVATVDVQITGLTAQVQVQIAEALTALFESLEPFVVGLSVPPRRDRITASAVASAVEQIAADSGGIVGDVRIAVNGGGQTLYILRDGEIATLGTITYD